MLQEMTGLKHGEPVVAQQQDLGKAGEEWSEIKCTQRSME
jgi:hypothetical protein